MNRKILLFYYSISIVFLLFLLLFGGWRFKAVLDRGVLRAEDSLADLKLSALSTYLAEGSFQSDYFQFNLKQQTGLMPRLLLTAIHSPSRGVQVLLARERRLLGSLPDSAAATWSGRPDYRPQPVSERLFSTPFTQDYQLDAVFRVLEWGDLAPLLRELFYLLVVYLLITVVILIAAASSQPSPRAARAPLPTGRTVEPARTHGLRSPSSGLGWREHLPARLEHELERSASFDQDLALLLVALDPRGPSPEPSYRALAQKVMGEFPFKDLCFEYDARTAAVILPDKDLAQALKEARAFQKKLSSAGGPAVCMGLGARNGRLISATRLLLECSRALERAQSEGAGRIVAFQADPEKYRAALAAAAARK